MAGALSTLKIIEVGEMVSAPYAAKLMADLGAEVIKVERPVVGDRARTRG
jgi:formyl-CoA transferase